MSCLVSGTGIVLAVGASPVAPPSPPMDVQFCSCLHGHFFNMDCRLVLFNRL